MYNKISKRYKKVSWHIKLNNLNFRLYKSNSNMETSAMLFDHNNLLSESTNAFSTGSSDKKLGIGLGVANNIGFEFPYKITPFFSIYRL